MEISIKYLLLSFILICTFQLYYAFSESIELNLLAKYNETCQTDADCDNTSQLKCSNGVCNCSHPDIMIFRNVTKGAKCYVKWGEQCYLKGNTTTDSVNATPLDCVPNSQCSIDGHCICINGTFQTNDGVCYLKRGYMAPCRSNSHCQEDKRFFCNIWNQRGFCDCNVNDSLIISIRHRSCVIMAGQKPPPHIPNFKLCVANAQVNLSTGKCECNPEFQENENGLCIAPVNGTCEGFDQPCAPGMTCVKGRCQCQFTDKAPENGTCYSKIGQPCFFTVWGRRFGRDLTSRNISLPCTTNALCSPNELYPDVVNDCKCRAGYVSDVESECQLDDGRGLLVGMACNITPTGNDTSTHCRSGAKCRTVKKGKLLPMTLSKQETYCKCRSKYKLNDDKTCTKIK